MFLLFYYHYRPYHIITLSLYVQRWSNISPDIQFQKKWTKATWKHTACSFKWHATSFPTLNIHGDIWPSFTVEGEGRMVVLWHDRVCTSKSPTKYKISSIVTNFHQFSRKQLCFLSLEFVFSVFLMEKEEGGCYYFSIKFPLKNIQFKQIRLSDFKEFWLQKRWWKSSRYNVHRLHEFSMFNNFSCWRKR